MAQKKEVKVARGVEMPSTKLKEVRKEAGSSNAGKYKNVKPSEFAGKSGGASKFSFPINTEARGKAALSYAHHAPDPEGIRAAVYRKYPHLKPKK